MSKETKYLKDICKIKSGKRIPKGFDFSEEETHYPYIRARDIKEGKINTSELVYLTDQVYEKIKKYIVNTNDVVITIVGASIGDVAFVDKCLDGVNLTENAVRLTEFDESVNSKYVFYTLNTEKYRNLMQQYAGGAAQPKLGIYKVESIPIELPNISIQNKVVDILSSYDDLIENNKKQIKLLEEAAQRLYKEWFVDLRFPGYENTEIIDDVPQGWRKGQACDFYEITIGKTPPRAEKQWFTSDGHGIPWVSISDMGNTNSYVFTTSEYLTEDAVKAHNVKIVPQGTVLLSFKLTVGRVTITGSHMCTNEAIAHFRISDEYLREYTYFCLKNYNFDSLGSTSAISNAVNSKLIKAMPYILPSKDVLIDFSKLVNPYLEQIKYKQKQNIQLAEARDRLLLKLMNGEIEV